jgi:hypothetical protein
MTEHKGFFWNYADPETAKALREVALNMGRPQGQLRTPYLEDVPPEHRSALSAIMRRWKKTRPDLYG